MALPVTFVDVFAELPLTGNGLAVVGAADGLSDETMSAFARETRLSETTFVQAASGEGADYRNRIFTPFGELPFAGHPSLGTGVAVARSQGLDRAKFIQQTGAGLQPIEVERREPGRWHAAMVQNEAEFGATADPEPVMRAVGLEPGDAHPDLPPQLVSTGIWHLIAPLASPDALERAAPDPPRVTEQLEPLGAVGLYLIHHEPGSGRVRARAFFGEAELPEDPGTGSAAGPACMYLAERTGSGALKIEQGAEMGRPCLISTEPADRGVRVFGPVLPLIDGEVRLPLG